jgi:uncharacterized protein (TIGR02001 family)
MRKIIIASVVAGAFALPAASVFAADAAPAAAPAPTYTFTGNVTLATDYVFRGITQSNGKPAIQGGFDYTHTSGFYVGTWASSISWLSDTAGGGINAPLELDIYGGYKNSFAGGDWTYDVGVLQYVYPGTYTSGFVKPDTTEIYGAIGWKWISLKVSDVVSNHIFGFQGNGNTSGDTSGSTYVDLTGTYDLGNGWGVSAHVGHQKIKDYGDASYSDYKIGITKDVGFGTVGLTLTDTNAKGDSAGTSSNPYYNAFGRDMGKSTAILSFTKTL